MSQQKFKNPQVNHQYKKPACHTSYCFERRACCNNYRCCTCHCCLNDFSIYDKTRDSCVQNHIKNKTSEVLPVKTTITTSKISTSKHKITGATAAITTSLGRKSTKLRDAQATTTKEIPVTRDVVTKFLKSSSGFKYNVKPMTTRWYKSTKGNYKSPGLKKSLGQRQERDDKTSTIAGVAVALALVAIVAIVVVVVICSKKKKRRRKMANPQTAKCSVDENGVVSIPLTLEHDDSCRDTEEATTSDTTIDSPINPINEKSRIEGSKELGHNHQSPNHLIKGQKSVNKKHRKSRDGKSKTQAEQKPLCTSSAEICSGNARRHEKAGAMESAGTKLTNGNAVCHQNKPKYIANSTKEMNMMDIVDNEARQQYTNAH